MSEITPNTPNPVREDEYYEALAAKLGIPASAIPRTPVWRNEEELAALVQLFTNMQGSSGGGVLVVHQDENGVLDKTWQEINDAGLSVLFFNDGGIKYVAYCASVTAHPLKVAYAYVESDGTVCAANYIADSADGHPAYSE